MSESPAKPSQVPPRPPPPRLPPQKPIALGNGGKDAEIRVFYQFFILCGKNGGNLLRLLKFL